MPLTDGEIKQIRERWSMCCEGALCFPDFLCAACSDRKAHADNDVEKLLDHTACQARRIADLEADKSQLSTAVATLTKHLDALRAELAQTISVPCNIVYDGHTTWFSQLGKDGNPFGLLKDQGVMGKIVVEPAAVLAAVQKQGDGE